MCTQTTICPDDLALLHDHVVEGLRPLLSDSKCQRREVFIVQKFERGEGAVLEQKVDCLEAPVPDGKVERCIAV